MFTYDGYTAIGVLWEEDISFILRFVTRLRVLRIRNVKVVLSLCAVTRFLHVWARDLIRLKAPPLRYCFVVLTFGRRCLQL